ncbi:MAG: SPOR domain-containing protein [Melioribacteraceae bacterium]|nr:SPOR domain-containing protein [Melioribacteraceae bacterium]
MKTEDLKKRILEFFQMEESDSELAYKLFMQRITQDLSPNDALKIEGLGVFQLKKDPLPRAERGNDYSRSARVKESLIYCPPLDDFTVRSHSLFLTIDINNTEKDASQFDESVFSLSVNQPLIPLGRSNTGTDFVDRKKVIQEKINSKINSGIRLKDFDIWTDYLSDKPKNASKTEVVHTVPKKDSPPSGDETSKDLVDSTEIDKELLENDENEIISISDVKGVEPEPDPFEEEDEEVSWDWSDELDEALSEEEEPDEEIELIDEDDPFASLEASLEDDLAIQKEIESEPKKVRIDKPTFRNTLFDEGDSRTLNTDLYEEEKKSQEKKETANDSAESKNSKEEDFASRMKKELSSIKGKSTHHDEIEEIKKTEERKTEPTVKVEKPRENISGNTDIRPMFGGKNLPEEPEEEEETEKPVWTKYIWAASAVLLIVIIYFAYIRDDSSVQVPDNVEPPAVDNEIESDNLIKPVPINEDSSTETNPVDEKQNRQDPIVSKTGTKPALNRGNEAATTTKEVVQKPRGNSSDTQISSFVFFDGSEYSKQVASFSSKSVAEKERDRIQRLGYNAFIVDAYIEKFQSTWYRVRVGGFKTRQEAENFDLN